MYMDEPPEDPPKRKDTRSEKIITNVICCARCEENHDEIIFKRLSNPFNEITHFGTCPKTLEPILLSQTFID